MKIQHTKCVLHKLNWNLKEIKKKPISEQQASVHQVLKSTVSAVKQGRYPSLNRATKFSVD